MSINVLDFKNQLNKNVLSLYAICGKDYYFRKQALNTILELVSGELSTFNVNYFTFADSVDSVRMALNTPPIMSEYKLVIWTGDIKKPLKEQQKSIDKFVAEYSKLPMMGGVLVLLDEGDYFSSVYKYAEVVDCGTLEPSFLASYVHDYIEKKDYHMSSLLIKELIKRCDNDMASIAGELEKLFAYCDGGEIDQDAIDQVVTHNVEQAVFELTDCITKNKIDEAYTLLEKLLAKGEQPLQLLGLILAQFKRIFYAKVSKESDKVLASQLGTKEYPIKLARGLASGYKPMELKKIVDGIQDIEYKIKSGRLTVEDGLGLAMALATKRR